MHQRLRPLPVTLLAVWTLLIWTGRLGLAWSTTGTTASKVVATAPVVVFVALGVVAITLVLRNRSGALSGRDRTVVLAIAAWTIVYWLVRLPFVWFDGRSVGFKAVHTALAVLSWAAAAAAIRALRSRGEAAQPSGSSTSAMV